LPSGNNGTAWKAVASRAGQPVSRAAGSLALREPEVSTKGGRSTQADTSCKAAFGAVGAPVCGWKCVKHAPLWPGANGRQAEEGARFQGERVESDNNNNKGRRVARSLSLRARQSGAQAKRANRWLKVCHKESTLGEEHACLPSSPCIASTLSTSQVNKSFHSSRDSAAAAGIILTGID